MTLKLGTPKVSFVFAPVASVSEIGNTFETVNHVGQTMLGYSEF